jgi:hypothetical protein
MTTPFVASFEDDDDMARGGGDKGTTTTTFLSRTQLFETKRRRAPATPKVGKGNAFKIDFKVSCLRFYFLKERERDVRVYAEEKGRLWCGRRRVV